MANTTQRTTPTCRKGRVCRLGDEVEEGFAEEVGVSGVKKTSSRSDVTITYLQENSLS